MKQNKVLITKDKEEAKKLTDAGFTLLQESINGVYSFLADDRLKFEANPNVVVTDKICI